jgi:hypothetical protein
MQYAKWQEVACRQLEEFFATFPDFLSEAALTALLAWVNGDYDRGEAPLSDIAAGDWVGKVAPTNPDLSFRYPFLPTPEAVEAAHAAVGVPVAAAGGAPHGGVRSPRHL